MWQHLIISSCQAMPSCPGQSTVWRKMSAFYFLLLICDCFGHLGRKMKIGPNLISYIFHQNSTHPCIYWQSKIFCWFDLFEVKFMFERISKNYEIFLEKVQIPQNMTRPAIHISPWNIPVSNIYRLCISFYVDLCYCLWLNLLGIAPLFMLPWQQHYNVTHLSHQVHVVNCEFHNNTMYRTWTWPRKGL